MSDAQRRALERLARGGDAQAFEELVRLLGREGDQEALCALGHHDVEDTPACRACMAEVLPNTPTHTAGDDGPAPTSFVVEPPAPGEAFRLPP